MAKSKARTWKSDVAHNMTEKELGKLQTRIEAVFDECSNEMMETANDYFGKLAPRIDKMQKELKNGNITNEQYQSWMRAQIGRGNQFYAMRDKLASYSADASTYAHDLISKSLPTTYAINRNYAAYQIDTMTGIDFNLWDEHTVNRLLVEKPDLMPHYPVMRAIDREINLAYAKTKITDVVTSGILQGWSIDKMSKRMVSDVVGMSKVSAVRAARTATTSAENAGRMDEFLEAESIGIDCEKEWMATLDGRTRHTHGKLDGVHVPLKEKFDNGLMYPAEPSGHPSEVYNCRCTLAPYFGQLDKKYGGRRKTYSEWVKEKENNGEKITIKSKASYQEIKDMMASNVARKATKKAVKNVTFERTREMINPLTGEVETVVFNNAFSNDKMVASLGADWCKAANDALESVSNPDVIKAFQRFKDKFAMGATDYNGARFVPWRGVVEFNADVVQKGNSYKYPFQNLLHEFGHAIDSFASSNPLGNQFSVEWRNGQFFADIRKDALAFKKAVKDNYGDTDKYSIQSYAVKLLGTNEAHNLGGASDSLEAFLGSYPIGGGHGKAYWGTGDEREWRVCTETFAHFSEGYLAGDKYQEVMQTVFPTAYQDYLEIMNEVANNV